MLVSTASLSGLDPASSSVRHRMAWALTAVRILDRAGRRDEGLPGGAVTFMAVSLVAFIILGSVLRASLPSAAGPLLFPIARQVGIHEVHYAMVGHPGDGHRPLRAAIRGRLLRRLRDQPDPSE
jgi:hypothetical protein